VQLEAVWSLRLSAGSEGSTLIFCTASHSSTLVVRSWRTFIDRPLPADPSPVLTHRGGKLWAERLDPIEYGTGRDVNVPLGQQSHDLGGREREAAVPSYRYQDYVWGSAVARKRRGGVGGEIPATGAAVIALTASSINAIAFRSGVVTRGASAHRCQVYSAPADFTNSVFLGKTAKNGLYRDSRMVIL
jgi:hypothetical protein